MEEIKVFGKQIFKGLAGMHEKGIAHRDLKPENILLKIPGNDKNLVSPAKIENVDQLSLELKICDLGAAKVLDMKSHFNTPYVVSRYYRAPELILGSIYYDYSIDVWATGCILFELITRTPMFPGDAEGLQVLEMAQLRGLPTDEEFQRLAKICEAPVLTLLKRTEDFGEIDLSKLLKNNSKQQYSDHDIELAADLIVKCLKWVPEDRISALNAISHPFF